jgi:uncharacterized protein YndB with AHSA1/START domain
VTRKRHRSAVTELPNDLGFVITYEFDAPIALVFDAFTTRDRAEMARSEGEEVKVYTNDLRVGGTYHHVFASADGTETSFRGIFLEVERPTRVAATWLYDAWPDAAAVESFDLHETDGVTTLTCRLEFRDQVSRDTVPKDVTTGMMYTGFLANFANVEDLLSARLDPSGTVSG